jgi:hypothetical protein
MTGRTGLKSLPTNAKNRGFLGVFARFGFRGFQQLRRLSVDSVKNSVKAWRIAKGWTLWHARLTAFRLVACSD